MLGVPVCPGLYGCCAYEENYGVSTVQIKAYRKTSNKRPITCYDTGLVLLIFIRTSSLTNTSSGDKLLHLVVVH